MAPVDRDKLLADDLLWLPDSNVLTDDQIKAINEPIIITVGDDDSNYPEILCKSLQALGLANKSKYVVDSRGIKKDKVGDDQLEFFEGSSSDPWKLFLDSLSDVCPLFGYTGLSRGIGIKINPSDKFVINDCPTDDLYL